MRQAHELLGADMLAVGIPRRAVLVTTDAKQPEDLLSRYGGFVSIQYHRADSAPISPMVFIVVEGQVVGMVKGMEDSGQKVIEEERESGSDVQCSVMVVREEETGQHAVLIIVGGEDVEDVARTAQSAMIQMVQSLEEDPEFGGQVNVMLNPAFTPHSEAAAQEFASVRDHLQGVVRELRLTTHSGEPVHVNLIYEEDRNS